MAARRGGAEDDEQAWDAGTEGSPLAGEEEEGELGREEGLEAAGGAAHWPASVEGSGGEGGVEELGTDAAEAEAEELEYELPAFASKENRALMEEIRRREAAVVAADASAAEHRERVAVMREHLKNVRSEMAHTERLLEARTRELGTEDELKALAEREIGRIRRDLEALGERAEQLADGLATVQSEVLRGKERLESFRSRMEFKQSELEQWVQAQRQKEDDRLAIERYTRSDEAKVKELTLALEKLAEAVSARRRAVEAAVTETMARQIELDKTASDFRTLHAERRDVVRQLQESVEAIGSRDVDIVRAGEQYTRLRTEVKSRRMAVDEEAGLLERQQKDNAEMSRRLDELGRVLGRRREELTGEQASLRDLEDAVSLQRADLSKAAAELAKRRSAVEEERAAGEEARRQLEGAEAKLVSARERREEALRSASALEQTADERAKELAAAEQRREQAERAVAQAKERLFRESERLAALRRREVELAADLSGAQAAGRNLAHEMRRLDAQAAQQAELVYSAEFQIQAMERKLARVKGDVSDEERRRLETRIAELAAELEAARAVERDLAARVEAADDATRKVQRRHLALSEELAAVQGAIAELQVQVRAGDAEVKAALREREGAQVERDVVRLEVRRLRAGLSERAEHVAGLENRKLQLEMSVAARRAAIEAHGKVQRAELKVATEERHALVMDLREREARVASLERRFEALVAKVRLPDDADPSELGPDGRPSQAYFVIKAAQKREELQRQGDELNAAVLQAERELRALAATLAQVRRRNASYRESFRREDGAAATPAELVERADDATDALFRRKRDLRRVAADADNARKLRADLQARAAALAAHIDRLRASAEQVQRDREAQRLVVAAAQRELDASRSLLRSHHPAAAAARHPRRGAGAGAAVGAGEPTLEERAVRAEVLRTVTHNALYTLGQLASEFPQLAPHLHAACAARGIRIPHAQAPRPKPVSLVLESSDAESKLPEHSSSSSSSASSAPAPPPRRVASRSGGAAAATSATTTTTTTTTTSQRVAVRTIEFGAH